MSHGLQNLGPFQVDQVFHDNVCKLRLPKSMGKTHPVFHPWLLHLANENPLKGQITPPPPPVNVDASGTDHEAIQVVRAFIDGRRVDPLTKEKGCLMYKVHYKDDPVYNQKPKWQPYWEVRGCLELVAEFHERNRKAPPPHPSFNL